MNNPDLNSEVIDILLDYFRAECAKRKIETIHFFGVPNMSIYDKKLNKCSKSFKLYLIKRLVLQIDNELCGYDIDTPCKYDFPDYYSRRKFSREMIINDICRYQEKEICNYCGKQAKSRVNKSLYSIKTICDYCDHIEEETDYDAKYFDILFIKK
ncbi:MAG: hypothetical protein KDH96_10295 [Candidatus Riesia sp.]|nr:hypothetical protein [Candidatus Riesia sp.]